MVLPITLTIAGALALVNLWLSLRTIARRTKGKVLIGDDDGGPVTRAMRAHANLVEYAPFVLILLGAIELAGGSTTWLWIAGGAFVAARLAHPIGLDRDGTNVPRAFGIGVTLLVLIGLALWALVIAYHNVVATSDLADPTPVEVPQG